MDALIDIIVGFLSSAWPYITSNGGNSVLFFTILILNLMMLHASIIIIVNTKRMQIRKEKSMEHADALVEKVNDSMIKHYYTLAKQVFGDDFLQEMETQITRYLYHETLQSRKNEMRRRVRKNGFDDKKPAEWLIYVPREIEEDITALTKDLDLLWPHGAKIKRDVAFDHNQAIVENVKREMTDLYSELLTIANEHKLKRWFFWRLTL